MILDRLTNREAYNGLGSGIPQALNYLACTDFANMPDGWQDIDGDRLFAIVQRYKPKPPSEARWEIHHRYADVQYIARGNERMGHAPWADNLPMETAYDPQRDLAFYRASGILIPVIAGMFAVLMPYELHAPCLAPAEPDAAADVLKIVVKCQWEQT